MFNVNDYVIYGKTGVCKITDIRKERFGNFSEQTYYILQPLYTSSSTIYAPVGKNLNKFRNVMSAEEVSDLIHAKPDADEEITWIEKDQLRNERFNEILKNGNPKDIISLIKVCHAHQEEQLSKGKKLHLADERIMKEAEQMMNDELAHVLNIRPDEVVAYIKKELKNAPKSQ